MSLHRDISTLNISVQERRNLTKEGYFTIKDICDNQDVTKNINLETLTSPPETKTALTLLEEERRNKIIYTFIDELDTNLKNILQNGSITELVGLPASGKTQLCLHLAISAQVIDNYLSGEVVYISTNLNFSITRLHEIAENYINKCSFFKNSKVEDLLKRIHYVSTNQFEEFETCLNDLERLLEMHKNINLIIIDSITYPLRQIDSSEKTPFIYSLMQKLRNLSKLHKFTVVLTNDMTTVTGSQNIIPSLRDTFFHIINNRVLLSKNDNKFHAEIIKSSVTCPSKCDYDLF